MMLMLMLMKMMGVLGTKLEGGAEQEWHRMQPSLTLDPRNNLKLGSALFSVLDRSRMSAEL